MARNRNTTSIGRSSDDATIETVWKKGNPGAQPYFVP